MNRREFMTQLEALLQDVPIDERREALQYYNDYFDDAGQEQEQQVIAELVSPKQVAATIKADVGVGDTDKDSYKEFSESGYTDTRFEKKETPAGKEAYYYDDRGEEAPRTSSALKVLLIIAIIVIGIPVILPVGIAIVATILGLMIGLFALFASLVIVSVALAIAGVSLVCVGIINVVPALAVGLALIGTGLILTAVGVAATIGSVKLCAVVFPGICRGIVWVCRRPFQGRAVV